MADATTLLVATWIGESRSGVSVCKEDRQALGALYDEGEINVNLIVRSGAVVTKAHAEYWEEVASEVADRRPTDKKMSTIKKRELLVWFSEPSSVFEKRHASEAEAALCQDVESEDDGEGAPPVPKAASTATGKGAPSTGSGKGPKKSAYSSECLSDMKLQGASTPDELYALSVGYQLAAKATPGECSPGSYGASVEMASAIKRIGKSKSSRTLNDLLLDASASGDISRVERHLDRMTTRFMSDATDIVHVTGATRLNRAWMKGRSIQPGNGKVAARYLWLLLDESGGRGLVETIHLEFMREAERDVGGAVVPLSSEALKAASRPTASDQASSVSGSVTGSSASAATTAKLEETCAKMMTMLAEVSSAQAALTKSVQRTDSRLSDLSSKVGPPKPDDMKGKCLICKKKGHRAADCPIVKANAGAGDDDEE